MTYVALEGTGATIQFLGSLFTSDLISLTISDKAREAIETTHLGTRAAKTYRPAALQDLGTIRAVFDHNPHEAALVGRQPEQIVIRYPDAQGRSFDPLVLWGAVVRQGAQRMYMDERMVTSVTIQLMVPDAVVFTGPPEVPAKADPTKWIGAWDLNTSGMANILTGKPAGPMATVGTYTWGGIYGLGGTGGAGKIIPDFSGGLATSGGSSTDPVDTFTISLWAKVDDIAGSPGLNVNVTQGSSVLILTGAGTQFFGFHSQPQINANWFLYDGIWHHYLFQYNSASGAYRLIVDGTPFVTGVSSPGLSTGAANVVSFNAADGGNFDPIVIDNIVITREYLSDAAIASLAAGGMPDASGVLA